MENKNELTRSVLKLMRAMRRRPMRPQQEFPPAVGRTLLTLRENDGASSAELCEIMDVRPSSMSELLGRMEEHGLVRRESSETDRRAVKVFLAEAGKASVEKIEARFREENEKLASCFSEAELTMFCSLCDRLSAHVEELAAAEPAQPCGPHHGMHHGGPCGPHGPHGCHGPHKPR